MPRGREDRDVLEIGERVRRTGIGAIRHRYGSNVVAQPGDLELLQLLHEPGPNHFHRHGSIHERIDPLEIRERQEIFGEGPA